MASPAPTPIGTRKRRPRPCTGKPEPPDLDALHQLTRAELKERWEALYGSKPPPRSSRKLLLMAVAYRLQEEAYGGLSKKAYRLLARAADNLAAGRPAVSSAPKVKPGTRLLREWQGKVHEVMVLEKGAEYRGETYPSLSAVARAITGARWSGPRFFGLKGKPGGGG